MPCNMFAKLCGVLRIARLTSRIVLSDCSFGWIACRHCLRGLRRYNSEPPHTCLLHGLGCRCDGLRDHGLAAMFLQLARRLSSLAGRIVLRLNHSYPLCFSVSFVYSDNGPAGALATCAAFWSVCVCSEATVRSQTRIVHETCWAGSHL